MIIEKDCLFLFKNDLIDRDKSIKYIDLNDFIKKDLDIEPFKELINKSLIIAYIDGDNRYIKYLRDKTGAKKDVVEKY